MIGDRFKAIPFQRPGVLDDYPELTEDDCREEMKLITSENHIYGGAEAAFRLLLLHPIWCLIAWIYFVPPFGWISDRVYDRIAERRHCVIRQNDSE